MKFNVYTLALPAQNAFTIAINVVSNSAVFIRPRLVGQTQTSRLVLWPRRPSLQLRYPGVVHGTRLASHQPPTPVVHTTGRRVGSALSAGRGVRGVRRTCCDHRAERPLGRASVSGVKFSSPSRCFAAKTRSLRTPSTTTRYLFIQLLGAAISRRTSEITRVQTY